MKKSNMKKAGAGGWRCPTLDNKKPYLFAVAMAGFLIATLTLTSLARFNNGFSAFTPRCGSEPTAAVVEPIQLHAILHYATSPDVPQQNRDEIGVTLGVLRRRCTATPCNFLVFGLGRDSLMWAALNSQGTTLFLEEDPEWIRLVLASAPELQALPVRYRTRLLEADALLEQYKAEPACMPPKLWLEGNMRCKLALNNLSREVYEREWDLIMIDAPRGYFPEAPGRMAAIYSAGVMARVRKGGGTTHVFLHDVDRKVEQAFAEEFLCAKNRKAAVGRLWHFEIPPSGNLEEGDRFCS